MDGRQKIILSLRSSVWGPPRLRLGLVLEFILVHIDLFTVIEGLMESSAKDGEELRRFDEGIPKACSRLTYWYARSQIPHSA